MSSTPDPARIAEYQARLGELVAVQSRNRLTHNWSGPLSSAEDVGR
jgi:hypothetical protein